MIRLSASPEDCCAAEVEAYLLGIWNSTNVGDDGAGWFGAWYGAGFGAGFEAVRRNRGKCWGVRGAGF
jgi:hypothetical protein